MGTTTNKLLASALWYAKRGWPVFPCRPRGKEPLTQHGVKEATTNLETIKGWWAQWPHANVGIATGAKSGLVVLDVDPRSGGEQSLEDLEAENGKMPATVEAVTGGGGRHILFRHPGGEYIKSRSPMLDGYPGLDVKADGGYIIAAPSVHPETGRPYMWEASGRPEEVPLAEAPGWLLPLLPKDSDDGHKAEPIPGTIAEGARNSTLTSLAGSLRRRGLPEAVIEATLLAVNNSQCVPPLPEEEVKTIAASVARYEPQPWRRSLPLNNHRSKLCPGFMPDLSLPDY